MSTIAERVAAGEAFLDEYDPSWWRADVGRAIDPGVLDVASGCWCPLGQRYGSFATGLHATGLAGLADCARFGFLWEASSSREVIDAEIDALNAQWRHVITARREAVTT